MSVILFRKDGVYQELADAYEGLKRLTLETGDEDLKFYKSLRRMYFANVATFLCQYHDNTPLSEKELHSIDTFQELQGKYSQTQSKLEMLNQFLQAWGSLKYNLVTNDGEMYKATEAYEYINALALRLSRAVAESSVDAQQAA